jgi:crotonobetainyl-CoA:carnitine CoA-transferase CaiB-like acyl-CoA transferase
LEVLGLQDLASDALFSTVSARMAHRPELEAVLTEKFRKKSSAQWEQTLQAAGIPAGPVLTINEMHGHPQVRAREMVRTVRHRRAGNVETLGCPVKFSATPTHRWSGAPLLGEHTREILASLEYSETEIEELEALGVTKQSC